MSAVTWATPTDPYNKSTDPYNQSIVSSAGQFIVGLVGFVNLVNLSLANTQESQETDRREIAGEVTRTTIDDLSAFGYRVLKPIPIEIEYYADDEFVASWPETGAAITSDSATGSIQALKFEIVESYEIFKEEKHLGAELQRQLTVLEEYLGTG